MAGHLFKNCRFKICTVCVSRIDLIKIDSVCTTFDLIVLKIDLVKKVK